MSTTVTTDIGGPIATIWLNGESQRNAVGSEVWAALPLAFSEADAHPESRVIVLRGRGGHFGAGADIREFAQVFASREATHRYFGAMEAAMASVEMVHKPTVAAIDGLCIGACVALALACDIRIASQQSTYAITPAKLGIAYPFGDIARVVNAIGANRTKTLMFGGKSITADGALNYGLVDQVADGDFETHLGDQLLSIIQNSPWTIRTTKVAISTILEASTAAEGDYREVLADAVEGPDFREGMAAFATRRVPQFGK